MEAHGLTSSEAAERLARVGRNVVPETRHRLLRLVGRQFRGIFTLLLLAAAVVTFLLGETVDGWFIVSFVVIGATLNVIQEHQSNAAADRLRSFLLSTIMVLRDGVAAEVRTDEIVPGDVLSLETGDVVPADAVVRRARDLLVDETTFTGETVPVTRAVDAVLLQGVVVVRGEALAEVTATGPGTRLAGIAATASAVHEESELVRGVNRISRFILRTTVATLAFIVVAKVVIEGGDTNVGEMMVFAIALAVSVIPEALPLVLTFTLSHGALEFARRDVIVKRLSSVQDLGAITLLCADKTGTLTENRLTLAGDWTAPGAAFHPLLLARLAAADLDARVPEPFDLATDRALSAAQRVEAGRFTLEEEESFDPSLRCNGAVVTRADGLRLHIRRGSPEYFIDQGLLEGRTIADWLAAEERQGHRVLGVSCDAGAGARFAGLVSFVDALKPTTTATLEDARALDVRISIITGDALTVAEAVGREAGLVTDSSEVVDATAFLALPHAEQSARAGDVRVFARTTPDQKLALIRLLKQQFTVGYLGEGINDAPALKAAHVSMVVQSAADVARESADIILLQGDLRVVVDGIRLGREAHANTMKYIRATLVSNFGNFYAVAVGSLFVTFLPMLPKQLLLLNLLSDFPMMAIAFDRVPPEETAAPQRYDFRALFATFIVLGLVSTVFDFVYFGLFFRISPAVLQTNWFIASVITELLLVFSIRSRLPIWRAGWPAPIVTWLSLVAGALAVALPLIPVTAHYFDFQPPSAQHLSWILGLAVLYLAATEAFKRPLATLLTS